VAAVAATARHSLSCARNRQREAQTTILSAAEHAGERCDCQLRKSINDLVNSFSRPDAAVNSLLRFIGTNVPRM
jgi:hypothetical protein